MHGAPREARDGVRVAVLELPATWGERDAALEAVDGVLAGGAPTDIVLLPEGSLAGFVSPRGDFDLSGFAEDEEGPTCRGIALLARRHGVHLAAPLVLREGRRLFNAFALFAPDGTRLFLYRKRHPWLPETWACAGSEAPPRVVVGSISVSIAICYDVHFLSSDPAFGLLEETDLLLFPSAWVDPANTRASLLERVARRHRVAVANANWAPGMVHVPGQGGSCVLDAQGRVVASVRLGGLRADATIAAPPKNRLVST